MLLSRDLLSTAATASRVAARSLATRRRPHPHVNPLSAYHQAPLTLASTWHADTFPGRESLPVHIDIGSADGALLLALAGRVGDDGDRDSLGRDRECECNYVGVDIRSAMVERSQRRAQELGLSDRVHFIQANANVSLATLLWHLNGSGDDGGDGRGDGGKGCVHGTGGQTLSRVSTVSIK